MIVREEYFPVMWLYFVQGVSNLKTLNDILQWGITLLLK